MDPVYKKILGINLLIFFVYYIIAVVFLFFLEPSYAVYYILAVPLHALINLVLSIIAFIRKKTDAGAYLLSSVLISIIGFGACYLTLIVNGTVFGLLLIIL